MKSLKTTTLGTIAAGLGLALVITAAPLLAQPQGARAERGARGFGDAPPAWRHDGGFGAGPMAHGPGGFGAPGAPGPAGIIREQFIRFWDRPAIAERLELSENQINLLNQSYDQTKPIVEENGKIIREAHRTIGQSLRPDGEPDLDAVNAAIDELTTAQNAVMKAAAAHRATVMSLLLDEQLDELQKIRHRQVRAAADNLRQNADGIRESVRRIAADGVFSDQERTRIEARLENVPERMRENILAAIERAVTRVAAGDKVGDVTDELSGKPAPRRALPSLPPDDLRPRQRDGSGPNAAPRARR